MNQMRDAYTGEQTKEFSLAAFIGLQAPSLSDTPDELHKLTQEYQENVNHFYVQEEIDLKENVKQLENDKTKQLF